MVLRLELLGLGDVNLTVIPLSVALRLEPQLLALGVHHRPIVVAHVRGEDDLLLVGRLEARQLDVDPWSLQGMHDAEPGDEGVQRLPAEGGRK